MNRSSCSHILNRLIRANNNRLICYKSSMRQLNIKKSSDLIPPVPENDPEQPGK